MNLAQRVWNSSPASLSNAVKRRLEMLGDTFGWHAIRTGPLAGVELCLNAHNLLLRGDFEPFIVNEIKARRSMEDCVCWDVGAHIGYHTLAMAHEGAKVIAFEPNPQNFERLNQHLSRNATLGARVTAMPLALSDRDGEASFVQSDDLKGESSGSFLDGAMAPCDKEAYASFARTSVKTVRLDTLIKTNQAPIPQIIKIDVEGAEAMVIQGGQEMLARHKPMLMIEVHHITLMFRVQALLLDMGYRLEIPTTADSSASRCFLLAK